MKKYEKYKNSGIEWMGEIPEYWEVARLRYISDVTTGAKDTENKNDEGQYPFYVRSQTVERIDSYCFNGEGILTAGDGVGVCKVWHHVNEKIDFHQRVYLIFNFRRSFGRFVYYFLKENFVHEVLKLSAKSTVDSLRKNMFLNFPLSLPPIKEQTQIANFLDSKTQTIDALIKKTEKKIDLLKEQRTAIINQAVTCGLDKNGELRKRPKTFPAKGWKDSGVEWIGWVPEEFRITRLATIGTFAKGKGISKSDISEIGIPCIRYGELYTKYEFKTSMVISKVDESNSGNLIYRSKNFVLFVGDGETRADIGKALVYNGESPIAIGGGLNIFDFDNGKADGNFLSYALNTSGMIFQKARSAKGEIVVHIYAKQIRELQLVLPEISRQIKIADYIDRRIQFIDKLIEKELLGIKTVKEYRQALISEVVTGKIKVTD